MVHQQVLGCGGGAPQPSGASRREQMLTPVPRGSSTSGSSTSVTIESVFTDDTTTREGRCPRRAPQRLTSSPAHRAFPRTHINIPAWVSCTSGCNLMEFPGERITAPRRWPPSTAPPGTHSGQAAGRPRKPASGLRRPRDGLSFTMHNSTNPRPEAIAAILNSQSEVIRAIQPQSEVVRAIGAGIASPVSPAAPLTQRRYSSELHRHIKSCSGLQLHLRFTM